MGDKNTEIRQAGERLQQKIAQKRAPSEIPEKSEVPEKVAKTVRHVIDLRWDSVPAQTPKPLPKKAAYVGKLAAFIAEMEHSVEIIDGKIANLMTTYDVTPEKIQAGYDVFPSAKKEDFVREITVEDLERGNIAEVGISGFESFRILKVTNAGTSFVAVDPDTHKTIRFQRSICLIEIKAQNGKRGNRELTVTFPLREGELLVCHDPKNQALLMKTAILFIEVNRKTVAERFRSLFS